MGKIVDFDTDFWTDPWVENLEPEGKLIFLYLWTNSYNNLAGLYPITAKKISTDTGYPIDTVSHTLSKLNPKVLYDHDRNIVFVVNFVRRQFMRTSNTVSPKIKIAIIKALNLIPYDHPFLQSFLSIYQCLGITSCDTVSVGYRYSIDTLLGGGRGKGKGKGKGTEEEKEEGVGEEKGGTGKGKKRGPEKHHHGEHLLLSDEEVEKLGERLGERLPAFLGFFNEKLGSKDYGLKSHYRGALTWGILAFEEFEQRNRELEQRRGRNGGGDPRRQIGPAGIPLSEMSANGQAQAVVAKEWLEESEARERNAAALVTTVEGDDHA